MRGGAACAGGTITKATATIALSGFAYTYDGTPKAVTITTDPAGVAAQPVERAVRAAGSANARNNVAVLIPCHRVVRTGGDLGGYAYGADIKRQLLERERGS